MIIWVDGLGVLAEYKDWLGGAIQQTDTGEINMRYR